MTDPLTPSSVLERMAQALSESDGVSSDLSSSLDAIALFVHACFVSLDFKLVGLSEDDSPCMSPPPSPPCRQPANRP